MSWISIKVKFCTHNKLTGHFKYNIIHLDNVLVKNIRYLMYILNDIHDTWCSIRCSWYWYDMLQHGYRTSHPNLCILIPTICAVIHFYMFIVCIWFYTWFYISIDFGRPVVIKTTTLLLYINWSRTGNLMIWWNSSHHIINVLWNLGVCRII